LLTGDDPPPGHVGQPLVIGPSLKAISVRAEKLIPVFTHGSVVKLFLDFRNRDPLSERVDQGARVFVDRLPPVVVYLGEARFPLALVQIELRPVYLLAVNHSQDLPLFHLVAELDMHFVDAAFHFRYVNRRVGRFNSSITVLR